MTTDQSFDIIQEETHSQDQQAPVEEAQATAQPPTAEAAPQQGDAQAKATTGGSASVPPPLVDPEPTEQPDAVFTREEEYRMTELTKREVSAETPLTDEERAELRTLAEKYQVFLAAGERKLREGIAPSESATNSNPQLSEFVDVVTNVATTTASTAATVAVAASKAAVHVGKGAFFWGTLVATAIPGYFGKKVGATTRFDHWNWLSDKLILGALPVVTQVGSSGNHLNLLKEQCEKRKRKLGLVVACLQEQEMQGFGVNVLTFAQKEHWKEYLGVEEYEHLPMVDFGAEIGYGPVRRAVDHMHHTMHNKGEAVYVHCKAGKGRSWMVVMCYLLTYGGMDWQTATVTIQSGRHQVHPGTAQQQFAQDFARRFQAEHATRSQPTQSETSAASPAASE